MPVRLEDGHEFIGVQRPNTSWYNTKTHAVAKITAPTAFTGLVSYRQREENYYYCLCGVARHYVTANTLNSRGGIDKTGDILDVTCKTCVRILKKYLGDYDVIQWEI